jgi:PAS domain S-box-containing protein
MQRKISHILPRLTFESWWRDERTIILIGAVAALSTIALLPALKLVFWGIMFSSTVVGVSNLSKKADESHNSEGDDEAVSAGSVAERSAEKRLIDENNRLKEEVALLQQQLAKLQDTNSQDADIRPELDLHRVFSDIQTHFILLDITGRILLFNKVAEKRVFIFDGPLRENIPILSIIRPHRRDAFQGYLDVVTKQHVRVKEEMAFSSPEGQKVWYSILFIPVLDSSGTLQQICFKVSDITEAKNREHALDEHNRNIEGLINNTTDLLWSVDQYGKLVTMNSSFQDLLLEQYGVKTRIGCTLPKLDLFGEQWVEGYIACFKGEKLKISGSYLNRSGEVRLYEASLNPIREGSKVIGVACLLHDTTVNEQVQRQLLKISDRYQILLKATNDAVWELDMKANAIEWNHGLTKIFGYSSGDICDFEAWWNNVHPEDRMAVATQFNLSLESGRPEWSCRYRYRCKDGSYKNTLGRSYVIFERDLPVRIIGAMQDLTELVETEKAYHLSMERYRLACKASGDVIWDHDLTTQQVFWSSGLQTTFGYPVDGWEDASYSFLRIHPDDAERVKQSWEAFLESGNETWREEFRFKRADGSYAYVTDCAYLIRDEDGRAVRIIGAMKDETDRVNKVAEIRKLSLVARHTNNSVIVCDSDFCVEWVNDAFVRSTRLAQEKIRAKDFWSLFPSNPGNRFLIHQMTNQLRQGNPASGEIRIDSVDGEKKWIRIDASPISDDGNQVRQYIMIQTDISQQKLYESKIISIARELSALIENANAVIFGVDRKGFVNEWNRIATQVTGFSKNEIFGKKLRNHIKEESQRAILDKLIDNVLKGKVETNIELRIFSKDETPHILLLNATARRDVNGEITGALVVGQEITELFEYRTALEEKVEQRTRELNMALRKEIELADMKKRFVSVASHEFRTPLSTINFSARFLRKYKDRIGAEQYEKKLTSIEQQVKHMTFLLDDVLTLGKYEAAAIQVKVSEVNVQDFFNGIAEEVSSAFMNTHTIEIATSGLAAERIFTDQKLLRNIFVNLCGNAIKFSPVASRVSVLICRAGAGINVTVQDYGIGIATEEIPRIFDAFHRGSNASGIQGTGLGLSIVKRSIELLKGKIEVTSAIGSGSSFMVTIPDFYDTQNNDC